jgi:hypothetical protein
VKYKLLLIVLGLISTATIAQSQTPAGINGERYTYCMNAGLGKGRPYTTPQAYCQQWAGPSASVMTRLRGTINTDGVGVPCGMTWNGNMIYMPYQRCEAYLAAQRAQEIAAHKAWLAKQAAAAKAAAAAAAAAAANNGGAIYNCSFTETSTPANGGGYPPITVPYTALAQQITADSLNGANAKAAAIARSVSNAYWVTTESCTELILLKDL